MAKETRPITHTKDERAHTTQVFGRVVLRLRNERDLTQEQLAWSTGLSRTFVSQIENGKREPRYSTILRLAQSLGIDGSDLLREVETELRRKRRSDAKKPGARQ